MAMSSEFKLRYVGSRYLGARLPLDVLGDLPAIRDLVAAFAEESWRELNPQRKRVPKGFGDALSFSLVRIEDGSAVPCLALDNFAKQPVFPGFEEYVPLVETAFNRVVKLFEDARRDIFPTSLSRRHVTALNQFGAALREGEQIEFVGHRDAAGKNVSVDSAVRRSLITRISETYQKKIQGFARLVANHEDGVVTIRDSDIGDVRVTVPAESVTQVYDGNIGSSVFYSLSVNLDRNDRLKSVVEVFDIGLIDDEMEHRQTRMGFIREIRDGWHDGEGMAPSSRSLGIANSFVISAPAEWENLKIFPTIAGGILFEFITGKWDCSVEVGVDGRIEFFAVEVDGPGEIELHEYDNVDTDFIHSIRELVESN